MTDKELAAFFKAIADDNQVKINQLTNLLQQRDQTIQNIQNLAIYLEEKLNTILTQIKERKIS